MTQIATKAAMTGGIAIASGKAAGVKPGAGGDFAALVAGMAQPGEEAATVDPDGFTLAGETDAETGGGTDGSAEEGKTGEPGILDLALGAAAQSAMADMVVTPPMHVTVQSAAQSDVLPQTEVNTGALPGLLAPATRIEGTSALRTESSLAATGAIAGPSPSSVTEKGQGRIVPPGTMPSAAPQAPTAAIGQGAGLPQSGEVPLLPTGRDGMAPAMLQQFAAVGIPLTASDRGSATPMASAAQGGLPVHLASQAVRNPISALLPGAENHIPANMAIQQEANAAAVAPQAPVSAQLLAQSASPLANVPTVVGEEAQTANTLIQPVMSALHRASAATVEAKGGDAVPVAVGTGEAGRRDTGTASDGSSNRESGGAGLASDRAQPAQALMDALPGGRQFADIIQGLPPIAQSRIGIVGDAAPVVAGAVDIGATLQGQAIDMTVGGQWIDRVAKEITALAQGTGHSRFQLSPPNLGRIQIDVWHGEEGGKVQLLTETDEAARQLRDGQSSLQADARLAALQLNSITIDRAATGFDTPRDQGNQQQNTRQQQGGDQNAQGSTQTGTQGGSQQNGQQNAQGGLQSGMQGGNSNGQGKNSPRRDVLNHQADTVNQQGGTTGRDGERLVRYA